MRKKQISDSMITYCNNCNCMTHSIRKGRAKVICGKYKHDKTLSDVYQDKLNNKNN